MGCESYAIEWKKHLNVISSSFESLLKNEEFVDVTIACNGRRVKAHKLVLSACSSFLKELLAENPCQHPIIILDNIQFVDLLLLLDFMYKGKMTVPTERIQQVVNAATKLRIKGLIETESQINDSDKKELQETIDVDNEEEPKGNEEAGNQTQFEETNRGNQDFSCDVEDGVNETEQNGQKEVIVAKRRKGIPVKRMRDNDETQQRRQVDNNATEKSKSTKTHQTSESDFTHNSRQQTILEKVKSGETNLHNAAALLGVPLQTVSEWVKVKLKETVKAHPHWQLSRVDSGD